MLQIKLEKFQGPLSLLLQIIEKQEMDITEISLAKVADQYVDYIKNLQKINPVRYQDKYNNGNNNQEISNGVKPDDMADFLVVAARLLLIKSRALLPYLYPEEKREIEEFKQQLKMYKEFLEAMNKIEVMLKKKRFMFAREFNRKSMLSLAQGIGIFSPPKKLAAQELAIVFQGIISNIRPEEKLAEKKLEHKINIEDKILAIQQMLINRMKLNFNKILANTKSKTEIIVSFLAVLELMKRKDISVRQEGLFNEMVISKI
ncbi:MAG: segregation/condensation protein A [Patescibacteria group bacterium]|nr:segregation/condensation protein A [Patescibacteria group bacterium]